MAALRARAASIVAGAGVPASRASDELTCQTAPSRTPIASMPSTAAGRLPKRCRNSTLAPGPIGATVNCSSAAAPSAVSPSTSEFAVT